MTKKQQKKLLTEIMEADARDGLYKPATNGHALTAVDWLVEEVNKDCHISAYFPPDVIKKAKQLEKEQIIDAWIATDNELQRIAAEQYYNKTYKK